MRFIARHALLAFVLLSAHCQRAAPTAVGNVDAGQNVAPSASSPTALSPKFHPALGGKPPSHWNELAIKGNDIGPLPAEVFGKKVRYDGWIHEKSMCLCSTGTAVCDDMTIRGVDWKRIPWAKKALTGGREARVTLRGVLSPLGLEVTEPPERLPEPKETVLSGPLPCAPPPGGFRQRHGRIGTDDFRRLIGYAEWREDLSHLWSHYHPGVTPEESRIYPPRPKDHVMVFRFVSNADEHRRKLEQLWGGPICVVQGGIDKEIREAIATRGSWLAATEGRKHGLLCRTWAGYFDGAVDELYLGVTAWDRKMFESWLSEELAGFPVRVRSELDAW